MENKLQELYLVLADISGFTSFVASTELAHSHDILAELTELLTAQLTQLFTLIEIEGDAVFVRAPVTAVSSGEAFVESLEATYTVFRDRVEAIRRQNTCDCNACRLIPRLDLKFISHCGDAYLQHFDGRDKPVGSPVNLVHRLSKNHVTESTGWTGYALFTGDALRQLQLSPDGMHCEREEYEHLGATDTYSIDLAEHYKERVDARRNLVTLEEAHAEVVVDLPAPPAVVWEWLNDPQKRLMWQGITIRSESVGLRGVGTRNHCLHGKKGGSIQTILDWRPFDYFTFESQNAGASKADMLMTHRLEPTAGGRD